MADTTTRIQGPVDIEPHSKERVAFDLMDKISRYESGQDNTKREYWLKLYRQSLLATSGYKLESILKAD